MRRPRGIFRRAGGAHEGCTRAITRVRTVTVLVVAASAPVIGLASSTTPAAADSVTSLRASIDHLAQEWFDAQSDVQRLDARITANEQRVRDLSTRAHALKLEATARAVDMYVDKSTRVIDVFSNGSALDSARRVQLIERANAKNNQTFDALSTLMHQLRSQRAALVKERDAKKTAAAVLAQRRTTLDAELRDARAVAARLAARAAATRSSTARKRSAATTRSIATEPIANVSPVAAPVAPSGGVHPMHEHPFLVCTRNRESRGNYSVVSASHRYYGAYQFLRTTWDVTANHAGRSELVGVVPNTASEYDQDDMAWTLYQWQGNAPWGGRC
jgi:peptidoglycan hydrolase CwlO-like protein